MLGPHWQITTTRDPRQSTGKYEHRFRATADAHTAFSWLGRHQLANDSFSLDLAFPPSRSHWLTTQLVLLPDTSQHGAEPCFPRPSLKSPLGKPFLRPSETQFLWGSILLTAMSNKPDINFG